MQGCHRERTGVVLFAVLLAAAGALLAAALGGTPAPGEAAVSKTYRPAVDAHVRSEYPTSNFGKEPELRTDGSPRGVAYLRFNLTGSDTVTSATLRLRSLKDSPGIGLSVSKAGDKTWSESALIYANAPAVGKVVDESGPFAKNEWVALDVTSAVKGNEIVTLALTTTSDISRRLYSRESISPRSS